jgi:hypothetical protein
MRIARTCCKRISSAFALQTLMPGKMVIARSKGNSPPEDVVSLRDAALGLDEKKGYITIGVAGRTSVWKGLNSEDTYKWHDALLSALAGYAARNVCQCTAACLCRRPACLGLHAATCPTRMCEFHWAALQT